MMEEIKIMSKNDIQVDWCFVIEIAFLHLNNAEMKTMLSNKDTIDNVSDHPNYCWSASIYYLKISLVLGPYATLKKRKNPMAK